MNALFLRLLGCGLLACVAVAADTREEPVTSPDGKSVAFLRTLPGRTIATGSGDAPAREIWIAEAKGAAPRLLVSPRDAKEPQRLLAGLRNLQFSPDGREIYFESAAWTTSGAIHAVHVASGKERFICGGNSLEVVPAGQYRGCLLVTQHRYFLGGGSFDWFWLLRPDGREIGPVGESEENFRELEMPGTKRR